MGTKVSVRPIQWNSLLDAIELISDKASVSPDLFRRNMGVSVPQSHEIARALHNMGFVDRTDSELAVRSTVLDFMRLWEEGNLRGLSQLLQRTYLPYQRLILLLKQRGPIRLTKKMPQTQQGDELLRGSKRERKKRREESLTPDEQERIEKLTDVGLNLASFNILTRLATTLGAVYVSDDCVTFSENSPDQQHFDQALLEAYERFKIPEGYASIVDVADAVCQKLGISILDFDYYFAKFYQANYENIRTSSAVMLKPKTPREMVLLQKRGTLPRFDRRQLVDGVNVGRLNLKAFKMVKNG
jgi:hypothetical protein